MIKPLIAIGESLHASIPHTGKIMRELNQMGPEAFLKSSPQLDYIAELIASQAQEGAAFIAVNVDDFVGEDASFAAGLMREYVKLIKKFGDGVPACIDSSNDEILIAGLQEYYNQADNLRKPMINSIKTYTMQTMLPLRSEYDFCFIALLLSEQQSAPTNAAACVNELYDQAKTIFTAAIQHGFTADDIYFDTGVFPLAIDLPMMPNQPSFTYRTFETIRMIKADESMNGVHFSLGFSNCCRDLPGRKVGITRAYVAKAIECGLDAGIVSVKHHFGESEPDEELYRLVDAYSNLNGDPDKLTDAMMQMSSYCASCR